MKLIKSLKEKEDRMWRNIGIPAVKLDMHQIVDRGRRRKKKHKCRTDYTLRHYEPWISLRHAVCFRSCLWHLASCGAATVWIMGGLIDEGIAHNHPPVCTIPQSVSVEFSVIKLQGLMGVARCLDQNCKGSGFDAALWIQSWTFHKVMGRQPC